MYLKLTTLEMERARRIVERDSLVKRLSILDERLRSLDVEQAELKACLDGANEQVENLEHSRSSLRVCSIQY